MSEIEKEIRKRIDLIRINKYTVDEFVIDILKLISVRKE